MQVICNKLPRGTFKLTLDRSTGRNAFHISQLRVNLSQQSRMTELTYITTVTTTLQPLSLVLVWSWTVTKRQGSYGDVAHPLPGMNPIYCRLIKKLLSEYRLTTLSLKDIGHQDITKPMQWRVAS